MRVNFPAEASLGVRWSFGAAKGLARARVSGVACVCSWMVTVRCVLRFTVVVRLHASFTCTDV